MQCTVHNTLNLVNTFATSTTTAGDRDLMTPVLE